MYVVIENPYRSHDEILSSRGREPLLAAGMLLPIRGKVTKSWLFYFYITEWRANRQSTALNLSTVKQSSYPQRCTIKSSRRFQSLPKIFMKM